MRRLRVAATAAGDLALGNSRFISPGQRVLVAASGATADDLSGTFAGAEVIGGNINIESSADVVNVPRDMVGSFVALNSGELILSLAGTVTGTHVDIWILQPGEQTPW